MRPASVALLGAVVFASTNVDDIFLLLGFFSDSKFTRRGIVLGQYLGIGMLFLISTAVSFISLILRPAYVGLLGVVPIAIGVRQLMGQFGVYRQPGSAFKWHRSSDAVGHRLTVAVVTIANGADNLGVYIPIFAAQNGRAIAVMGAVFVFMTALWCAVAHWLVDHTALGVPIRLYGHRIMPFMLIALGVFIVVQARSYLLLAG